MPVVMGRKLFYLFTPVYSVYTLQKGTVPFYMFYGTHGTCFSILGAMQIFVNFNTRQKLVLHAFPKRDMFFRNEKITIIKGLDHLKVYLQLFQLEK